jgi:quercetin dioxygenase-like cupin family protein
LNLAVDTANVTLEKPLKRTARRLSAVVDFQNALDFFEGKPETLGLPNEPDSEPRAVVVDPVTAFGPGRVRFLLEGEASGGSVAIFEFDVPARAKLPAAHSHDGYEETIYGLEGVLTWTLDGRQTDVGPGEVLCIPRGTVHRFDNGHRVGAKMLAIVSPGVP